MQTDTFLLIVFLLILTEYILRLRASVERRAEEKFKQMKTELLHDEKALAELIAEAEKVRASQTAESDPEQDLDS